MIFTIIVLGNVTLVTQNLSAAVEEFDYWRQVFGAQKVRIRVNGKNYKCFKNIPHLPL